MKIIWVGNIVLPSIAENMGLLKQVGGGWMVKISKMLSELENVEFTYMFPDSSCKEGCVDNLNYIAFPIIKYNSSRKFEKLVNVFRSKLRVLQPDIIHVFGTEYVHSRAIMKACEKENMVGKAVISIQGLVSEYAECYYADLPERVIHGRTLKNVIRGNIEKNKKEFEKLGKSEVETLRIAKHVIGRTDWDKAACWAINPDAEYHFNNEVLRDSFYQNQWNLSECHRHSIFFSQAHYPIKGLHYMLEALSILANHYSDVKLVIGGKNFCSLPHYRLSYYETYIMKLIRIYGLENHVDFTGYLQEREMCENYLNANVFVCASSIENSPNSVGEAMILGVPTVSSDVGGVKNMLEHEKEGFIYQTRSTKMLAYYVSRIFDDDDLACELSENARRHAKQTHEIDRNFSDLLNIYGDICDLFLGR